MSQNRIPKSVQEAKEQAADYFGFTASAFIQTSDGKVWEIPNPGLMDDDQQERWEELQFILEGCDRDEIVIQATATEPERKYEGELLTPYRKDGELLKPPYNVRLAQCLFGDKGYKEYKAGGGIANQIALEWARMNREYQERVSVDPKSDGNGPTLEVVPAGD